MNVSFENFLSEWRERAILRAGLWLILAIVWIFLLWEGHDALDRTRQELTRLNQSLEAEKKLIAADSAQARLNEVRGWHARASDLFFRENSLPLAEARWRDWLIDSARARAIEFRKLSVASLPSSRAERSAASASTSNAHAPVFEQANLHAQISASFDPKTFFAFLAATEKAEQAMQVARLKIQNSPPAPTVELDLVAIAIPRTGSAQ